MLHILWILIKILLIILAVALGLLLAMILLFLFCPVRYRAAGAKQDSDIHGTARISWLFGGIAAVVRYSEKKTEFQIRLFGISLETYQKLVQKICSLFKRKKSGTVKNHEGQKVKNTETDSKAQLPEQKPETSVSEKEEKPKNEKTSGQKKAETTDNRKISEHFLTETDCEEEENPTGIFTAAGRICKRVFGIVFSFFRKLFSIGNTLIHIPQKIFGAIHKVWKSICHLCENIQKWKAFIDDERTRGAIRIVWEESKRLLRHISPRKVKGNIIFGLENPCITGQVYGLICATCPIHNYIIDAEPVFDDTRLDAELSLKGRIYLIIPVISGLRLLLDKNIQFLIRSRKKED